MLQLVAIEECPSHCMLQLVAIEECLSHYMLQLVAIEVSYKTSSYVHIECFEYAVRSHSFKLSNPPTIVIVFEIESNVLCCFTWLFKHSLPPTCLDK